MIPAGELLLGAVSAVAIAGRGLLIEGPPGSGKSSLALALIDRGARLIGDDGVQVSRASDGLCAAPPPRIAGLLEVRNVGLITLPCVSADVALILRLDAMAPRHPLDVERRDVLGVMVPVLQFAAGDGVQALRAEHALRQHGLAAQGS